MAELNIGDIVSRNSYKGDVLFRVVDIIRKPGARPVYVLRGLVYRITADSHGDDLIKHEEDSAYSNVRQELTSVKKWARSNANYFRGAFLFGRVRTRPGKVLHLDSDDYYLETCRKHYTEAGVTAYTQLAPESEQPYLIRQLLGQYNPDILVVTGHDSIAKGADKYSLESYRNSKYYIQSVREARKHQSDKNKLCIFAGACQSYYEAIIDAGANFASSPGRVLINALDPAIVGEKVALTDERYTVTASEIARITKSGSDGIGGISTRGHLRRV